MKKMQLDLGLDAIYGKPSLVNSAVCLTLFRGGGIKPILKNLVAYFILF